MCLIGSYFELSPDKKIFAILGCGDFPPRIVWSSICQICITCLFSLCCFAEIERLPHVLQTSSFNDQHRIMHMNIGDRACAATRPRASRHRFQVFPIWICQNLRCHLNRSALSLSARSSRSGVPESLTTSLLQVIAIAVDFSESSQGDMPTLLDILPRQTVQEDAFLDSIY